VQTERIRTAELLAAAEHTSPGELFIAAGETMRRTVMKTETTGRILGEPAGGGRRRNLTFEEHRGFWTWAMVEVLRHTGVRIEELAELSHHSLIQYRLPDTGQLIPLLQITPSKTDAERLLVISPELADVLSTIVARIRRGHPHVAPVVSYDKNERVYNPPLPLLFQWRRHLESRAVTETSLRSYLDHALTTLGVREAGGHPMRYTFHDFRRLFITDAIMHGMPPHSAQLVAGHRDINTTMGAKAVYPDEVINGHGRSSPAAAHCAPARNTAHLPTKSGPSSSVTSSTARSPLATAAGLTTPPASTNTAACAARSYAQTRPPGPVWSRSVTTSSRASPRPSPVAGSAKPKD
jgi:hypothetical protein